MDSEQELYIQEKARRSHLAFLRYTWTYASIPFLEGHHIKDACARIDDGMKRYRNGDSVFIVMKMPFRHHKSQTVTRSLPPHWIGEFPEDDIIVASYSADLSHGFSRDARSMINSRQFSKLYKLTSVSRESSSVNAWEAITRKGSSLSKARTSWVGLGGSITGKGGNLIIVDDFLKGRSEAESKVYRDKTWESFANEIMTRRAQKCFVIVLATPWHTDDIFGRIKKKMKEDSNFPRFNEIVYPAKSESYPTGYLFPEKFSKQWYESQYATLGKYGSSGLLDCDPTARDGMLLKVEEGVNWQYCDGKPHGFGRLGRAWDLASTSVQVLGDNPDWTVGVRGAIKIDVVMLEDEQGRKLKTNTYSIYVDDIVKIQAEAPRRDKLIQTTAIKDGSSVLQGIESVAGYKDTFTTMKSILKGVSQVKKLNLEGDKVVKVTNHLSLPFDSGMVYIDRKIPKSMLDAFMSELKSFPSVAHDDQTDAFALMVAMLKQNSVDYKSVNE